MLHTFRAGVFCQISVFGYAAGLSEEASVLSAGVLSAASSTGAASSATALAATLAADVQAAAPAEEKPEGQHRYVCKVCGYVYEGDSLPEDYKCPLCGAGAEYFKQES